MARTERFYKIEQLLRSRRVIPFALFLEKLEVSGESKTLFAPLMGARVAVKEPIIPAEVPLLVQSAMRRYRRADEKPLYWVGSSKGGFLGVPGEVVDSLGYALSAVQFGGYLHQRPRAGHSALPGRCG